MYHFIEIMPDKRARPPAIIVSIELSFDMDKFSILAINSDITTSMLENKHRAIINQFILSSITISCHGPGL